MLIKKRKIVFSAFIMAILVGINCCPVKAQEITLQNKLKLMLSNFNNVRFSSVSYYELNDRQVRSLKEIIKRKLDIGDEVVEESSSFNSQQQDVMDSARTQLLVDEIRKLMANRVRTFPEVRRAFDGDRDGFEYLEDYNANDIELRLAFQMAQPRVATKADIYRMFLITTPVYEQGTVPDIVALILCKERIDKDEYESYLINFYNTVLGNSLASEKNILTYPELMNFIIEEESDETKTTNLYDKLIVEFRQGNFQQITQEVRGIGTELKFVNTYGKTSSMIMNENNITNQDIGQFIRVSEGQPFDYTKSNELVLSYDLISYKRYQMDYYEDEEGKLVAYSYATNANLPSIGLELKYGLDEIGYPSIWSDRMMLRAIWDNAKLGVVLPSSGWSSLSEDLFDLDRKMTYAGVGVSGTLDFPMRIIPQSGIFSLSGSYVFGDAQEAKYKNRRQRYEEHGFSYDPDSPLDNDYLIRYTGQLHYTFGFTIDGSYLLRFGLGATIYGAEKWHDVLDTVDFEPTYNMKKANHETIGSISMKFEFMSTDVSTPFGASLQYFDETIFASAWLQIPIVRESFFLRVEGRAFSAAFRETIRPWENKGIVFLPSARLIFNF